MDEWMDGRDERRMGGQMDGWTDGDGRADGRVGGRTDGWMDE